MDTRAEIPTTDPASSKAVAILHKEIVESSHLPGDLHTGTRIKTPTRTTWYVPESLAGLTPARFLLLQDAIRYALTDPSFQFLAVEGASAQLSNVIPGPMGLVRRVPSGPGILVDQYWVDTATQPGPYTETQAETQAATLMAQTARTRKRWTRSKIRNHLVHGCDGPVTEFVAIMRALDLAQQEPHLDPDDLGSVLALTLMALDRHGPLPSTEFGGSR